VKVNLGSVMVEGGKEKS